MSADFEKLLSKAFAEYADEEFGKQAEIQYYPISKKELKWAKAQDNKRRYKKPMWQINLQRCAAILLIFCSLCAVVLPPMLRSELLLQKPFLSGLTVLSTFSIHRRCQTRMRIYICMT